MPVFSDLEALYKSYSVFGPEIMQKLPICTGNPLAFAFNASLNQICIGRTVYTIETPTSRTSSIFAEFCNRFAKKCDFIEKKAPDQFETVKIILMRDETGEPRLGFRCNDRLVCLEMAVYDQKEDFFGYFLHMIAAGFIDGDYAKKMEYNAISLLRALDECTCFRNSLLPEAKLDRRLACVDVEKGIVETHLGDFVRITKVEANVLQHFGIPVARLSPKEWDSVNGEVLLMREREEYVSNDIRLGLRFYIDGKIQNTRHFDIIPRNDVFVFVNRLTCLTINGMVQFFHYV